MPEDLWNRILESAADTELDVAEWIRQVTESACDQQEESVRRFLAGVDFDHLDVMDPVVDVVNGPRDPDHDSHEAAEFGDRVRSDAAAECQPLNPPQVQSEPVRPRDCTHLAARRRGAVRCNLCGMGLRALSAIAGERDRLIGVSRMHS
jgi:hypothetical protein